MRDLGACAALSGACDMNVRLALVGKWMLRLGSANMLCKIIWFVVSSCRRLYRQVLRRVYVAKMGAVGRDFQFDALTSVFVTPQLIYIGDRVFFNMGAYLSGKIRIGNGAMFGPFATILSGNHLFGVKGKSVREIRLNDDNPEELEVTVVEDEVWVGANVTVLGGLTVGFGAVVGAGSVVTRDVPPFTVAVGNPCRPIRRIFEDPAVVEHLCLLGYTMEFAQQIVWRRKEGLNGLSLPLIDKTHGFAQFYYRGRLEQN